MIVKHITNIDTYIGSVKTLGGVVDVEVLEVWPAEVDAEVLEFWLVDAEVLEFWPVDAEVLEFWPVDAEVLEVWPVEVVFGVDVEVATIIYRGLLI